MSKKKFAPSARLGRASNIANHLMGAFAAFTVLTSAFGKLPPAPQMEERAVSAQEYRNGMAFLERLYRENLARIEQERQAPVLDVRQLMDAQFVRLKETLAMMERRKRLFSTHRRLAEQQTKNMTWLADPERVALLVLPPERLAAFGGLKDVEKLDVLSQGLTLYAEAGGEVAKHGLKTMAGVNRVLDNSGGGMEATLAFARFSCWGEHDFATKIPQEMGHLPSMEVMHRAMALAAVGRFGAKAVESGLADENDMLLVQEVRKRLPADTLNYANPSKIKTLPPWLADMMGRLDWLGENGEVLEPNRRYDGHVYFAESRIAMPKPVRNPARGGGRGES
ncbi:MAG: hypothetical protein H6922_00920 [Pseudomonadaceae bacterium]|nr:hypothetical protein [Pseudomonadaceae bacterium]